MQRRNRMSQTPAVKTTLTRTIIVTTGSVAALSAIAWLIFAYLNVGKPTDVLGQNATYSSGQSGNWTTATTWSGSTPPISGLNQDNVTINSNHAVTLNGDLGFDNQSSLTIGNNGTLTINGDLIVNNSLTLLINGDLIVNGKIEMKNGASITVNGGGGLTTTESVDIGNNASFTVDGVVNIGGSLSFGTNATFAGNGEVNVSGAGCSRWSGTGTCNENMALPVELVSFEAKESEGGMLITWVTATEENNDFFTLERSADGKQFEKMTEVQGKGTTLKKSTYEFLDEKPLVGRFYYRLMQTDYDGKFEIFRPIVVEREAQLQPMSFTIFPNPLVGQTFTVRFATPAEGQLVVLDHRGNEIHQEMVDGFDSEVQIDLNGNVEPGIYVVNFRSDKAKGTVKLLKK